MMSNDSKNARFPAARDICRLLVFCLVFALTFAKSLAADTSLPELFSKPVIQEAPSAEFKEVSSELRGIHEFSGNFSQEKKVAGLSRALQSSGTFRFLTPEGLCWRIRKPFYSDLLVSDEEMVQKDENGRKEKLFTENAAVIRGFSKIFLAAFAGETKRLSKQFDTFFSGSKEAWQLGFRPKSSQTAKFISYIILHGAKTTEGLTIVDGGGDTTTIRFSDVRVSRKASDTPFARCLSE